MSGIQRVLGRLMPIQIALQLQEVGRRTSLVRTTLFRLRRPFSRFLLAAES